MDLRIIKTEESLRNAFLILRKERPTEKISVKELSQKARVNKATFYLHYADIYDFENHLEDELAAKIITDIDIETLKHGSVEDKIKCVLNAFAKEDDALKTLTTNDGNAYFADKLESKFKKTVSTFYKIKDEKMEIELAFFIRGSYFTYMHYDMETILSAIVPMFKNSSI